jgi:hypothetical protein
MPALRWSLDTTLNHIGLKLRHCKADLLVTWPEFIVYSLPRQLQDWGVTTGTAFVVFVVAIFGNSATFKAKGNDMATRKALSEP